MWKVLIAIAILGALGTALFVLIGFNQMSEQISVRPYESPQMLPPTGTVSYFASDTVLPETQAQAAGLANPVPYDQDSVLRGDKAYRNYCLACHGSNLDGYGPVGPSLPARIPHLTGDRVKNLSDGELYWHLINGGKVAPPIGRSMTEQELWNVINFLRFKQGRNYGEPAPTVEPTTEENQEQ